MFKSDSVFARFMNMLADSLLVGILWVLCSLLVLTSGTATTAAYYAIAKCVRHREGYVAKEFFKSFKDNVKQMLPLTALFIVLLALLGYEIVMCWMNRSTITDSFFVIEVFLVLVLCGHAAWICPLASRFQKRNWDLIKMAALAMFKYLYITLAVLVVFAASVFGIIMTKGWGIWFIPGLCMFICSLPIEWALRRMMPRVDPDSEEGQKWYYQDFKRKK